MKVSNSDVPIVSSNLPVKVEAIIITTNATSRILGFMMTGPDGTDYSFMEEEKTTAYQFGLVRRQLLFLPFGVVSIIHNVSIPSSRKYQFYL